MLKSKSVVGPTLDTYGQFEVAFDEFQRLITESLERAITNTATGGAAAIPMTNTSGFRVGQVITIRDSAGSESRTISAITPSTTLTVGVNLTNTYTVARGGMVTVTKYGAPRVSVYMDNPFTDLNTYGVATLVGNAQRLYGTIALALTQGELMTGGTSAATGRLIAQGTNYVEVVPVSGTFVIGETLTGGTSGRTITGVTPIIQLAPYVVVTVEKAAIDAGPDIEWSLGTTAQVAGMNFNIVADGE